MATFQQIMKDLKAKKFAPVYLFMGDESYYIDQLTNYLAEHALSETDKAFNQSIFFGEDLNVGTLDNAARRYPMMAAHQLIIVKEAQKVKALNDLHHYATNPSPTTILVLAHKYKSLAKNTKLYKAIDKAGVVFESKKIYDDKLPHWITEYLAERDYKITPQGAAMIADNLGTDLSKVANELDKLFILLPKGSTVQPADIEKNIGISKDFNNFELIKAITARDVLKANRIINYFAQSPREHPMIVTTSTLFGHFQKLLQFHYLPNKTNNQEVAAAMRINPYFVRDYQTAGRNYPTGKVVQIIGLLREYDMRSKGYGNPSTPDHELLKELVFKIIH